MKKTLLTLFSWVLVITFISSLAVSAESAVTQSGEAKSVTSTFPAIDGAIDDIWTDANAYYLDIIKVGSDTGVKAYYKLLWSPTTLYTLIVVPDTTPNPDASDNYQRDCVEVGIDFSNARTTAYENDDQFHVTIKTNGDGVDFKDIPGAIVGDQYTWAMKEDAAGYIIEFAIACDKLGIALNDGKMIAMDVQVNDNAEGDGRTGCYAWNDDSDASYNNPTALGEIKLVATSVEPAPVATVEETAAPAAVADAPVPVVASAPVAVPQTSDTVVFSMILVVLAVLAFATVKKVRTAR